MRAELGPRVVERLRAFEKNYIGGCAHTHVGQWVPVSGVRSSCLDCLRERGPVAPWEVGPCTICGRAMPLEQARMWAVQSVATDTIVVVRSCEDCTAEQTLALGEPEHQEEKLSEATRLPFKSWLSITAGAEPRVDLDRWTWENTLCCLDCATGWVDRAEGRRTSLALHDDCREALAHIARASFARSRRLGAEGQPREHRIAAMRGMAAVREAGVAA